MAFRPLAKGIGAEQPKGTKEIRNSMRDGALPRTCGSADPADVPVRLTFGPTVDLRQNVTAGALLTNRTARTVKGDLDVQLEFYQSLHENNILLDRV